MLTLENISANYGSLTAISDVSLTLDKGARVGIFGHNGAGKTTLLKCVVGAHAPSAGRVTLDGEAIDAGDVSRNVLRGIAFVPQGHNVFPNLSVEQNLKISGLLFDASFATQVYELFPVLQGRRTQRAGSMSGGEQQMLALGMALMTKPKWLLLDEPCTGLAPIIIETVMQRLGEVSARFGTGLIVVEQNVPATLKLIDRAIILKAGRIVYDGAARDLAAKKDLWNGFEEQRDVTAVDVDLLVIGAGACGLAGAIAAHDAGIATAIVEKRDKPGGNSSLSTGSLPGAGSRFQNAAGIEDSPERLFADLMAKAGTSDCPDLVRHLCEHSAPTVEWLVDAVGARLSLITAYKHVGHSVARLHAPVSRRGQDLVDDLLAAVSQRGIPLAVGNGVQSLIVDDGAVHGARVVTATGERSTIRARKTLLAVNGYAGNPELVRRFCPEVAGATYFGALGSTGEAVVWGEALGAQLSNIGAYQGYAAVADPHGSLLSWTTIEKGGLIVDAHGQRFGDESAGYSGFTRDVMAASAPRFAIFDQKIFDIAALEEEFVELAGYGGFKSAATAGDLAILIGTDPIALGNTIAEARDAASGDQADRHGRRDFGLGPLTGKLYACRVVPGLFHTQGGLAVDLDGRVLDQRGRAIPNLFAGGGATGGLSGRDGGAGYASGNGLLSALALGRLAGLAAAAEVRAGQG